MASMEVMGEMGTMRDREEEREAMGKGRKMGVWDPHVGRGFASRLYLANHEGLEKVLNFE